MMTRERESVWIALDRVEASVAALRTELQFEGEPHEPEPEPEANPELKSELELKRELEREHELEREREHERELEREHERERELERAALPPLTLRERTSRAFRMFRW